jgi:hypothetical protein
MCAHEKLTPFFMPSFRFFTSVKNLGLVVASGIVISQAAMAQQLSAPTPPTLEPAPTPVFTPFDTTEQIKTGLWLRRVSVKTDKGALRYFVVKANRKFWNLNLQIPNVTDALKKRNVRGLAADAKAPVAINGGFFAYGGAAVGAVKVNGKWQRMPWKNRTALGWTNAISQGATAQIGAFPGTAKLFLKLQDGSFRSFEVVYNGFTFAGAKAPLADGFAVLTPFFASKYLVKTNEIAAIVRGNDIISAASSGEVEIPQDGFLLVARGSGITDLSGALKASFEFSGDKNFDKWPNILGAGPRLVENGVVKTTEVEEEFRPDVLARGPRSAIGFDKAGNWIMLAVDGRQANSVGLSLPETAKLLVELGAYQAMNLDGGSSTQLIVNGELANNPSGFDPVNPTRPREVMVSNALVFVGK